MPSIILTWSNDVEIRWDTVPHSPTLLWCTWQLAFMSNEMTSIRLQKSWNISNLKVLKHIITLPYAKHSNSCLKASTFQEHVATVDKDLGNQSVALQSDWCMYPLLSPQHVNMTSVLGFPSERADASNMGHPNCHQIRVWHITRRKPEIMVMQMRILGCKSVTNGTAHHDKRSLLVKQRDTASNKAPTEMQTQP